MILLFTSTPNQKLYILISGFKEVRKRHIAKILMLEPLPKSVSIGASYDSECFYWSITDSAAALPRFQNPDPAKDLVAYSPGLPAILSELSLEGMISLVKEGFDSYAASSPP